MNNHNYEVMNVEGGRDVKMWTRGVPVEEAAKQQLANAARMPFIYRHVAAMPDVHLGKGATVGSVIATRGAVIPAAVGVDIGCFTGDTEVVLADSKLHRLADLASAANRFVVFSCTPQGRIHGAGDDSMTRPDAALVEVELDNGARVRCTPDHPFMLSDGTFEEASDLTPGASLMPFYWCIDKEGYSRVMQPNSAKFQRAHWLMARSGVAGGDPVDPWAENRHTPPQL